MIEFARLIATWFYCGYTPKAPGTAGSLAAAAIAMLLARGFGWSGWQIALLGALLCPLGIWASTVLSRELNLKDPQIIVVDEVVGQWIAFAGITLHDRAAHVSWIGGIAAFALFRLFDIWKPWPVHQAEQMEGGTGIVMDDVLAGIYAALVLFAAGWFNLY
jgi:phosphatidylglycerophosphatase A